MKPTPAISVLMTAYNREQYIGEAIESVLNSEFKNFELIIVDDRSSDRTVEIVRKYAKKDDRIRLYINDQNLGDYPNRNKAASYARGKYIKFVDSDDKIYKNCLELMYNGMEQFRQAAWGVTAPTEKFSESYPVCLQPQQTLEHYLDGAQLLSRSPLSLIFRTDTFQNEGGFLEVRQWGDAEFSRRLALKYPLVVFQPALGWYREHPAQENAINTKDKKFIIVACNEFIDKFKSERFRFNGRLRSRYIITQRKKQIAAILGSMKQYRLLEAWTLLRLVILNTRR